MAANPEHMTVKFKLNGKDLEAMEGETILQAAKREGTDIPHLCYKEGYRPDGNCRACMVEIEGERVLAASCCRTPTEGMQVKSDSERAVRSQKMVLELLKSDMPDQSDSPYRSDSELDIWARKLNVGKPRFESRHQPEPDVSNPPIAVNLDACIQCTRCVRACREEQVNDVIGFAFRGAKSEIVFDIGDPMGLSTCVSCGECVQACPTGALMPAKDAGKVKIDKKVNSTCPYCGVGCLLTINVQGNTIKYVEGRDGVTNKSRLCVKGRYGFDYVHHSARLTTPRIRREGVPKTTELVDPKDIDKYFRKATWEAALDYAANGLKKIRDEKGPKALAGFGSAKGSNEEAYLFQKLVRTGFKSNNVDHCTRLCHASSVVAMLETVGSGAVSNPVSDVSEAEVLVIIGSKPSVNHPVAATFMKNAVKQGKKLIVIDPYRGKMSRLATHFLQLNADTDVPLLNSLMYTIIEEGLQNDAFIEKYTEGYDLFKENLKDYSPEKVAPICGVPAEKLRAVARLFATASGSMIFWGMGISQHIHGTDNARCLISLSLLTGQIGRPGTGIHPLRGQNNVQGASDVGLIPMVFPDYEQVNNLKYQAKYEKLWNTKLDPEPGLTVVETMMAIHSGDLNGMYIQGENPAMSDPNLNHARKALSMLDHLVVQDIFLTETAGFADVILPASAFPEKTGTFTNTDRRVQMGRQAIEPPVDARQDLWIIQEIAKRMGLDWDYSGPKEVFNEMRQAMHSIAGMTWERLEEEDSLIYPLSNEGDPGTPTIHVNGFPTMSGKGKFVAAHYIKAAELPDEEYPFIFTTGRQLEHWHTGSMTRHASMLDELEPIPVISINPVDMEKIGCLAGDNLTIESRRGKITAKARLDPFVHPGSLFMAFCYKEAAANLITTDALDPFGKIPEFKYCAIKISSTPAADN